MPVGENYKVLPLELDKFQEYYKLEDLDGYALNMEYQKYLDINIEGHHYGNFTKSEWFIDQTLGLDLDIQNPSNLVVTLYSQDFVEDGVWLEVCQQVGLDGMKIDKLDLYLKSYEANK